MSYMDVCEEFHGNPSNNCWHISVWNKVVHKMAIANHHASCCELTAVTYALTASQQNVSADLSVNEIKFSGIFKAFRWVPVFLLSFVHQSGGQTLCSYHCLSHRATPVHYSGRMSLNSHISNISSMQVTVEVVLKGLTAKANAISMMCLL